MSQTKLFYKNPGSEYSIFSTRSSKNLNNRDQNFCFHKCSTVRKVSGTVPRVARSGCVQLMKTNFGNFRFGTCKNNSRVTHFAPRRMNIELSSNHIDSNHEPCER